MNYTIINYYYCMNKFKQFKKILNDDDLKNPDFVKEYLTFSFHAKRPKKDFKLYINICKIHDHYPDTIKELLNNIPQLGYYKDYFFIYNFSKSDSLNNYILDLVIKQLRQDIDNLKQGKEVSTIGKFLPRENSKLNDKNSFIDAFCAKFYPDREINNAKRKYRKLKTTLNEKLGTLEPLICTKQFDKINFNKVSQMALKNNKNSVLITDEMKAKFDQHETEQLKKLSLASFIKEVLTNKHSVEKMQNLWEHNRFCMEIPFIYRLISNSVCIVDLSKDAFNSNSQYFTLGITLLIDQFSLIKNKTIVCKNSIVTLKGNILERAIQLLTYCGPCKELDAGKLYELVKVNNCDGGGEVKNLIFVSGKELTNYDILADKKITLVHYIPNGNDYNIRYFNGSKIREFKKYTSRNVIMGKELEYYEGKKDIGNIIVDSNELNDRTSPIIIVTVCFFLWLFVSLYGQFIK